VRAKFQIPNPKSQIFQISKPGSAGIPAGGWEETPHSPTGMPALAGFEIWDFFGIWDLGFLWSLGFGIWSFE